jgi:hypothetical protein
MLSNSSNFYYVYYGSFKLLDKMESLIVATKDHDKENKKGNTSSSFSRKLRCNDKSSLPNILFRHNIN